MKYGGFVRACGQSIQVHLVLFRLEQVRKKGHIPGTLLLLWQSGGVVPDADLRKPHERGLVIPC